MTNWLFFNAFWCVTNDTGYAYQFIHYSDLSVHNGREVINTFSWRCRRRPMAALDRWRQTESIFSNRATKRDSISDIYRALNLVLTKLAHAKCRKCVQHRRLTVDTWRLPISYNLICRFNFSALRTCCLHSIFCSVRDFDDHFFFFWLQNRAHFVHSLRFLFLLSTNQIAWGNLIALSHLFA